MLAIIDGIGYVDENVRRSAQPKQLQMQQPRGANYSFKEVL